MQKRIFSIFCVFILLLCSQQFSIPTQGSMTNLITDTFSTSSTPEGYTLGAQWSIIPSPDQVGDYALRGNDITPGGTGTTNTSAVRTFAARTGIFTCEFKYYQLINELDPASNYGAVFGVQLNAGNATTGISTGIGSNISAYDGTTNKTNLKAIDTPRVGRWVPVKIVADIGTDTYEMWIDSTKIVTNTSPDGVMDFRAPLTQVTSLTITTSTSSHQTGTMDICFDNIKIYDGSVLSPSISLVSPADAASITLGQSVSMTTNVTGDDISKVEFYANNQKIGEDTTSPYALDWVPSEISRYDLYATATNVLGEVCKSSTRYILVQSPAANLVTNYTVYDKFEKSIVPPPGYTTFEAQWSIIANPTVSSDYVLRGNDTSPSIATLTSAKRGFVKKIGIFTIELQYYQAKNANTDSNAIYTIQQINGTSSRIYAGIGSNVSVYDGTSYQANLKAISNPIGRWIPVQFVIDTDQNTFTMRVDGEIITTSTSPDGILSFRNIAANNRDQFISFATSSSLAQTSEMDIYFDNIKIYDGTTLPVLAPVVTLDGPADRATYNQNISIPLTATAVGENIAKVEFYANNQKIGEDATAPYTLNWTPNAAMRNTKYALYAAGVNSAGVVGESPRKYIQINVPPANVQASYYVDPNGSDTNPGTAALPLKTITKARDIVRTINSNMTGDIVVYMAQGDYVLPSTVAFNEIDSGTNGYKVIYKNKDAVGSARILGGAKATGWAPIDANPKIYKTNVGANIPTLYNLYENEKLGRLARYPNFKPDADYASGLSSYLVSDYHPSDVTYMQYAPNELNPASFTKFSLTDYANCVWWVYPNKDWGINRSQISSFDTAQRKINFTSQWTESTGLGNERYFIEGIYELLDVPGEFYYDKPTGDLYYWPMDGNPNNSEIIVPRLTDIITVKGSSIGTYAHNITFDGLYFYGSKYSVGIENGAGIVLLGAKFIDIVNCHFKNLGGHSVMIINDSSFNTVYNCWMEHLGSGGVYIRNRLLRTQYPQAKTQYNYISNCIIQDYTELAITMVSSGGVTVYSASDNVISHCEIMRGGRYGITMRGNFDESRLEINNHYTYHNQFTNLKIHHVGTDSGDLGALHGAQLNPSGSSYINYFRQITVDIATANPTVQDVRPYGVYLDHHYCSLHQVLSNIKLSNIQGSLIFFNQNPEQVLDNVSWLSDFDDSKMDVENIGPGSDFPASYGLSTTPNAAPELLIHPFEIVVDNNDAGYSESGSGWTKDTTHQSTINASAKKNDATQGATQSATWTPSILYSGKYDVYVWKSKADVDGCTAVTYTVNGKDHSVSYVINQAIIEDRWEKLGTHYFEAGTTGNVTMSFNLISKYRPGTVRADAVKFVPVMQSYERVSKAPYLTDGAGQMTTSLSTATMLKAEMWSDIPGMMIFALYDGNKLTSLKTLSIAISREPVLYSMDISDMQKNGRSAKAFIVSALQTITPLFSTTPFH